MYPGDPCGAGGGRTRANSAATAWRTPAPSFPHPAPSPGFTLGPGQASCDSQRLLPITSWTPRARHPFSCLPRTAAHRPGRRCRRHRLQYPCQYLHCPTPCHHGASFCFSRRPAWGRRRCTRCSSRVSRRRPRPGAPSSRACLSCRRHCHCHHHRSRTSSNGADGQRRKRRTPRPPHLFCSRHPRLAKRSARLQDTAEEAGQVAGWDIVPMPTCAHHLPFSSSSSFLLLLFLLLRPPAPPRPASPPAPFP